MIMFVKRKYIDRHRILQVLQENQDQNLEYDENQTNFEPLSFSELVRKSGLSETQVYAQVDLLAKEDEISIDPLGAKMYYMVIRNGTIAYFDGKYLNQGKKELRDEVYDKLKIISTIVLLSIAIISFIVNIIETRKNKKEIETLKREILIHKGSSIK